MAYNQGYGAFGGQGQQGPSAPPYGFVPPPGGGYPQQGPGPFPQQQGPYPQQGGYPPPPLPNAAAGMFRAYADPEMKSENMNEFGFSEKSIRMAFIRKVYGILMVQLLVTFGFIALFVLNEDVKGWSRSNPGFLWGAFAITLVTSIALACCEGVRRKAPGNFICLAIFTIAEGFMLGAFSSVYKAEGVLLAIGITAVVCLALTAFSFQTKFDFTTMGSALFVILIVFVLFGFLAIFLPKSSFPILHIVYAAFGALLFSFYLIYDTQLMIGGSHKYSISPEEYIFAALNLYLDIINIFMYILSLLGTRD